MHSVTDAGVFYRICLTTTAIILGHCNVCGEIWTLGKVDQKCLESLETCCWRRMEKISWIDSVRKGSVAESEGGVEYRTYSKKK